MLKQTLFRNTIKNDPRIGDFDVLINIDQYPGDEQGNVVGISSFDDINKDPLIHVKCELDADIIQATVQKVCQGHIHDLMEREKEDIAKFLTNRGFTHYVKKSIIGA